MSRAWIVAAAIATASAAGNGSTCWTFESAVAVLFRGDVVVDGARALVPVADAMVDAVGLIGRGTFT